MRLAKKALGKSAADCHSKRLGAVIVFDDGSMSVGSNNMWKTHPLTCKHNPLKHTCAEINAFMGRRWHNPKGGTVYVYREFDTGEPALAKPCKTCIVLLKLFGIRKVVFTTSSCPYYQEMVI